MSPSATASAASSGSSRCSSRPPTIATASARSTTCSSRTLCSRSGWRRSPAPAFAPRSSVQRLAIQGGAPAVPAGAHVRWPVLGEEERSAVLGVLERGVLSGQLAPEVRGLEREFAAFVGSRFCLATNSGTAALHLALIGAGLQPGDEVIVPAFTFVATAMAVLHQGAVPVFVDVEPRTFGMDPAKVEAAIGPRTRAIVPVHLHGVPCDLEPIARIASRHGLVLIEDSAQAIGARYRGRTAGTIGLAGSYSLQSSKSMACGEGGLVVTDDETVYRKAQA